MGKFIISARTGFGLRIMLVLIIALINCAIFVKFAHDNLKFDNVIHRNGQLHYVAIDKAKEKIIGIDCAAPNCFMPIDKNDIILDPNMLGDFEAFNGFMKQQKYLLAQLERSQVKFVTIDENGATQKYDVVKSKNKFRFSADFWTTGLTGLLAFLIGGTIWAARPNDLSTKLLAFQGIGFMVSHGAQGVWYGRTIAMEPQLFGALLSTHAIGSLLFAGSLIALFASYPKKLVNGRVILALFTIIAALIAIELFAEWPSFSTIKYIYFSTLLVVVALIITQALKARNSASDWNTILWLGLPALMTVVIWGSLVLIYASNGHFDQLPENSANASYIVFYVGMGIGVSRFRLFELSDYAFRIVFYATTALLFAVLDAVLIMILGIAQGFATPFALILVGAIYLPLREYLWKKYAATKVIDNNAMLNSTLEIVLAPNEAARFGRWKALLNALFDPIEIAPVEENITIACIEKDGQQMLLPQILEAPALRLIAPNQGRSFFKPSQLALIGQLMALINSASESRIAYERGAKEERLRLAQDLHDDVGARLLSALVIADEKTRGKIHEALHEIRAITSGMNGQESSVEDYMAQLRHESVHRLESAAIAVNWPLWLNAKSEIEIDSRVRKALKSLMREAISNIIKHSKAKNVNIKITAKKCQLNILIADDGIGFEIENEIRKEAGLGLSGAKMRVAALNGSLEIINENGTKIMVSFPLVVQAHE